MGKCQFVKVAKQICVEKEFKYIDFLGYGAYKETYLAQNKKRDFALKIIDPLKSNKHRIEREIQTAFECQSPSIAKIINYSKINYNKIEYQYVCEEYLGGGTLAERLDSVSKDRDFAIRLVRSILEAIKCLKEKGRVHRDIKPENIMFREIGDVPVLVDLGLVRDLNSASLTQDFLAIGPGTPYYASPEQLNNEKALISWKSDQFSLAVVIAQLMTGRHPFGEQSASPHEAVSRVVERKEIRPWFIKFANKNKLSFLIKMLSAWPIRRYNSIEDNLNSIK